MLRYYFALILLLALAAPSLAASSHRVYFTNLGVYTNGGLYFIYDNVDSMSGAYASLPMTITGGTGWTPGVVTFSNYVVYNFTSAPFTDFYQLIGPPPAASGAMGGQGYVDVPIQPPPAGVSATRTALCFGDSTLYYSQGALTAALAGSAVSATVNAISGRPISQQLSLVQNGLAQDPDIVYVQSSDNDPLTSGSVWDQIATAVHAHTNKATGLSPKLIFATDNGSVSVPNQSSAGASVVANQQAQLSLVTAAAQRAAATVLDNDTPFLNLGSALASYLMADGIHPNSTLGQPKLAAQIAPVLVAAAASVQPVASPAMTPSGQTLIPNMSLQLGVSGLSSGVTVTSWAIGGTAPPGVSVSSLGLLTYGAPLPAKATLNLAANLSDGSTVSGTVTLSPTSDTGTPDSGVPDTGIFNGTIGPVENGYINLLIHNFGIPAIFVCLAVCGWMFVRRLARKTAS